MASQIVECFLLWITLQGTLWLWKEGEVIKSGVESGMKEEVKKVQMQQPLAEQRPDSNGKLSGLAD